MIYNLDNTIFEGKSVKGIVDANGLKWWDALELDTDTGRLLKMKRDDKGRLIIDLKRGKAVREVIFLPTPVVVLFDGPERRPPGLSDEFVYLEDQVEH